MTTSTRRRTSNLPWRGAVLVAAMGMLLAASPVVAAEPSGATAFVDEARAKMRKNDVRGAIAALEKAIAADGTNPDAHILYQDLAKDSVGVDALVTTYRQKMSEHAEDPLFAFLYARLL